MATLNTLLVTGIGTGTRDWIVQSSTNVDEAIASADGLVATSTPAKDITQETSFALANVNTDFASMDTLSWQLRFALSGLADDTYYLDIAIYSGATLLAAATSGGTWTRVATLTANRTMANTAVTGFAYVNTSATKTQWDAAEIKIRCINVANKAGDGATLSLDTLQITGTYTSAGNNYDETGRQVTVASTVALGTETYVAAPAILRLVAVQATGSYNTTAGTNYDETGKLVTVTSTVSVVDVQTYAYVETGLAVSAASTVSLVDTADFFDSLLVSAVSTVAVTDVLERAFVEAVALSVVSTVAASDFFSLNENRQVDVVSTVVGTDLGAFYDTHQVAISSTVAGTGGLAMFESVQVDVVSTIAGTDVEVEAFYENDLAVSVVSTIAVADVWGRSELLAVSAASTVASSDLAARVETGLTVGVVSTVAGTDNYTGVSHYSEPVQVDVVSTVAGAGLAAFYDAVAVSVASTVSVADVYTPVGNENFDETGRQVTAVSLLSAIDNVGWWEIPAVTVNATLAQTSVAGRAELPQLSVVSTVTQTELQAMSETLLALNLVSTVTHSAAHAGAMGLTFTIISFVGGYDYIPTVAAPRLGPLVKRTGQRKDWPSHRSERVLF